MFTLYSNIPIYVPSMVPSFPKASEYNVPPIITSWSLALTAACSASMVRLGTELFYKDSFYLFFNNKS